MRSGISRVYKLRHVVTIRTITALVSDMYYPSSDHWYHSSFVLTLITRTIVDLIIGIITALIIGIWDILDTICNVM
jgi:hypothetical protein